MTIQDIVPTVVRLPLAERLAILEVLLRSVREELSARVSPPKTIPFERLCGILKQNGAPPSDDTWQDDYADYLIRKYA
jgi:hypothetical protein